LDWLWEDECFGPYGLGAVMKKHKITHCMGWICKEEYFRPYLKL
jgi:hypothetical protein